MCNCRCVCRAWRMCARAPMSVWSHPGMLWLPRLSGGVSGMTLCQRRKIDGIGHRNAGGGCAARSVGRPRFYHGRGWPQGPWGLGLVLGFWFCLRRWGGLLGLLLASGGERSRRGWFGLLVLFAGIRAMPSCFRRRP
ncbi:hypothetical protein, partial [Paraburkholderia hospita]|uniref:hypothetical protein n=3 Tax=Paraburkholderia hospita TaxID=169430 RepID=UPI003BFA2D9C